METVEIIVKLFALITGGSAAGVIIWKVMRFFVHLADDIKDLKEYSHENLSDDIEELKKHSLENHLGILRLTVMSKEMPLGERIVAGDKYIKEGGNGEVKKFIEAELHINEIQNN